MGEELQSQLHPRSVFKGEAQARQRRCPERVRQEPLPEESPYLECGMDDLLH